MVATIAVHLYSAVCAVDVAVAVAVDDDDVDVCTITPVKGHFHSPTVTNFVSPFPSPDSEISNFFFVYATPIPGFEQYSLDDF